MPTVWISVLTSFGCLEGSRATGSVFQQLFRKPGAVGSRTRKTCACGRIQFYILPHTHTPAPTSRVRVCTSFACYIILPTAPGFRNSWKTDPVALEPSKQPKEVSTLIQTVGIQLIQDGGLQIAETTLEGGTSLYHLRFSVDK